MLLLLLLLALLLPLLLLLLLLLVRSCVRHTYRCGRASDVAADPCGRLLQHSPSSMLSNNFEA
jgi:hypothetical protein